MGWNHRVMRHPPDPALGEREAWYAIHEVFYASDEVDDRVVDSSQTRYTADPIAPWGEDVDELRRVLEQMLAALDKPVLEYGDASDAAGARNSDGNVDTRG